LIRTSFFMWESMVTVLACQGVFCIVLHRKIEAGDAIGRGRWIVGHSFEKSAHRLVVSPDERAFMSTIQIDLSGTSFFMSKILNTVRKKVYS
jgi:hypothetical protein